MAIADDLRRTFTDLRPLYFAAGTADIAVEQARKVPGLIEQLRVEAPSRIDAMRNTDPKAVQDKVAEQAKEAQATVQAKVNEVFGLFDTDLRKMGESAQDMALRSLGMAAEYAVRAREAYEKVAERGEQSVRAWRGEAAEEITETAVAVEPKQKPKPKTAQQRSAAQQRPASSTKPRPAASRSTGSKPAGSKPAASKSAASKSATSRPAAATRPATATQSVNDSKPEDAAKPAAPKPAAAPRPAETTAAQPKPAESKPAQAQPKPAENHFAQPKPAPAARPAENKPAGEGQNPTPPSA